MVNIYGVDTQKPITSLMVRDAIVECFAQAHCMDAALSQVPDMATSRIYCKEIVKKAFEEKGGDFDHPSKESLQKAIEYLAQFSSAFRDPEVIQKHKDEIGQLIQLL